MGERTRVELVYRPAEKIPLESIVQYLPKFNDFYTCSVITDLQVVRTEKRAMILAQQHGLMTPNELLCEDSASTSAMDRWFAQLHR